MCTTLPSLPPCHWTAHFLCPGQGAIWLRGYKLHTFKLEKLSYQSQTKLPHSPPPRVPSSADIWRKAGGDPVETWAKLGLISNKMAIPFHHLDEQLLRVENGMQWNAWGLKSPEKIIATPQLKHPIIQRQPQQRQSGHGSPKLRWAGGTDSA